MVKIYNTLGRELQEFKPQHDNEVSFYQCGPTVYSVQHIGNMRAMVMADLIRRSLSYMGYKVRFVRNYTDVGHLVSDEDAGEDKMEKGAKREGLSPQAIAQKYIDIFEQDMRLLNILPADIRPRASDYVPQMIEMVEMLLEKGFAYSTPTAIYFDTTKAKDYTKLSGQKLEENEKGAGSGEVVDNNKRHPADFAVWFFKTGPHKNALQYWQSPFSSPEVPNGEGFPGWHIECSAMTKVLLGDTIDVHMGGIEHIPTHHTNEIAQSESANGVKFVNYWLHNEHLNVDDRKMAKSEGTGFALSEIIAKGYDPLALRYFFLQAHYRSKQNFTWEALTAAQTAMSRLVRLLVDMEMSVDQVDQNYKQKFIELLSSDFNVPGALALVWDLVKDESLSTSVKLGTALDFDKVLGLNLKEQIDNYKPYDEVEVTPAIQDVLDRRAKARADKDWKLADEMRDTLKYQFNLEVEDTATGQKVKPVNS